MKKPVVSIAKGKNIDTIIKDALDLIGGIESFVSRGDTVLIKPNCGNPFPPVCTHPEVVASVVQQCMTAKPKKVFVGESSAVGRDTLEFMEVSGIKKAAEDLGAQVVDLKMDEYRTVNIPRGKAIRSIEIAKTALECDVFINIPIMKTHLATTITCALKNMKGILRDSGKRKMHRMIMDEAPSSRNSLSQAIADLNTIVKSDVIVVDGTVAMEGLGPVSGDPVRMDLILAGTDPVAVDSTCARIMGIDPKDVDHIVFSYKHGIGRLEYDEIQIRGERIERVWRRFKLSPSDLKKYYKYVTVLNEGACSSCVGAVVATLERIKRKGLLGYQKGLSIILGSRAEIPPKAKRGNQLILCGNCTQRFKDAGIFLPGCPPRVTELTKAILERKTYNL